METPATDNTGIDSAAEEPAVSENRLTSERLEVFQDALQTLYIKSNQGGRINFTKEWEAAALYILGEELISYDTHGGGKKEQREALEEQAEDKQFALIEILETLEERSAKSGALQVEYVKDLILSLGRDLSLNIYAAQIVDQFITPPPASAPLPEEAASSAIPEEPVVVSEPAESEAVAEVSPEVIAPPAIPEPPKEQNVPQEASYIAKAPVLTPPVISPSEQPSDLLADPPTAIPSHENHNSPQEAPQDTPPETPKFSATSAISQRPGPPPADKQPADEKELTIEGPEEKIEPGTKEEDDPAPLTPPSGETPASETPSRESPADEE